MSVKWKHKLISKESNAKSLCLFLVGAGFFKDKKGDIDVRKISLFVSALVILIGFIYLVMAAPVVGNVVLNSTSGNNLTNDNLTVWTDQDNNASIRLIYDWRRDGESFALVNLPFDYGTNASSAIDFTSHNHGIFLGGESGYYPKFNSTFGAVGGSVRFETSTGDERITISAEDSSVPLQSLMNDVTISMWVYIDTLQDTYFYQEWDTDNKKYQFGFLANGTFRLYDDIDTGGYSFYGTFTFATGTWYHVVVVGGNRNWKAYVDGNLVLDADSTDGIQDMDIPRHTRHYFGARRHGATADWAYELIGSMDEIMIFNSSLSGQQIRQLYNEQNSSLNSSTIVYEETAVGDVWSVNVTPVESNYSMGVGVLSNNLIILEDTCICPSSPQNWSVNMADYCWLNSVCNISGYDLTFYGIGNFTVNSTLYVNEIKNLSSGMTVWMKPDGVIYNGAN